MAVATIALGTAILLLPGGTTGFTAGLDDSWQFVVSKAIADGLVFGREIVFPYGPLGFVITDHYYPDTFLAAALIRAAVALIVIYNAAMLFDGLELAVPVRITMLAALATVVAFSYFHEAVFFSLGILIVARHFLEDRAKPDAALALLAFALAATSLVKFTYFVSSTFLVIGVGADTVLRHRRVPWLAAIFVGGVIATWLALAQPLGDLLPYLVTAARLSSSYNEAKALHLGDPWVGVTDANAWFLFAATLVVAAWRATAARANRMTATIHALCLAGILFVIFKASFVRNDEHSLISADTGLVLALCYLPVAVRNAASTRMAWVFVGLLVGLPVLSGVLFGRVQAWEADSLFRNPVGCTTRRLRHVGTTLGAIVDPGPRRRAYDENLARIREEHPIPIPTSSVDLICNHQTVALAYGLNYSPRPIFQSYSAHSPFLMEKNAEFFRGPRAPGAILYQLDTLDMRYPAHDDSLAFLEILRRYRAAEGTDDWILLERTGAVRDVSLVAVGERTGRFDEPVEVPAGEGLVWVAIDIEPTLVGRIASLLYKPPMLFIKPDVGGLAAERQFRLVPTMAREGFLLSPFIADTKDVRTFMTTPSNGVESLPPVRAIRIGGTIGAGIAYYPEFRVRFYRLEIESGAMAPLTTKGEIR